MSDLNFDIVICVGPKDEEIIERNIEFTRRNIIGYRNIYLVCANPDISINDTITIDEKIFPFSKLDLIELFGNNDRIGWYLQQLLKIYAGNVIPGILTRYLVLDSDTFFLKPTKFITDDGKHIFTTGTQYHADYFIHMNKLHPSLNKHHPLSGISHHLLFHNDRINELIKLVEDYHSLEVNVPFASLPIFKLKTPSNITKCNSVPFWKIFLEKVLEIVEKKNGVLGSDCSEYEMYFNFMFINYPDEMIIRQLKWENAVEINVNLDFDFQAINWYNRK